MLTLRVRTQGIPVIDEDDEYDEDAIVDDVPDDHVERHFSARPRSLPFTAEEDAISSISLDRSGEMKRLLRMIQDRLSLELRKKNPPSQTLLPLLQRRSFWLRCENLSTADGRRELELALRPSCTAGSVFDKFCIPEFFRDVFVWLPEHQFAFMPPCIYCGTSWILSW